MINFQNNKNENEETEETVKNQEGGDRGGSDESEIEELRKKLEQAEASAQENLAGWQRTKADFMNYKRDEEKSMDEFKKYASRNLIISLLPTVDSFNLAMKHLPADLKDAEWVRGVMCIKGMFDNFLRDAGVEEIQTMGKKFNPHLFEAVGEVESDQEEDVVVEEIQKGYLMGDRVIRPAKVKVAKGK